ncbi:MAG TPA: hypothetical protein VGC65_01785 [Bacteroidia bacterium]|jgi:hypothetical protein
MNVFLKLFFSLSFMAIADYSFASSNGDFNKPTPKNNDTVSASKSNNIVIFKMIPGPSITNNSNGSLKRAGKVARTSNSRS